MTRIKGVYLVLAISQTNLYQFVGQNALLEIFQSYNRDVKKIQDQAIVISSKHQQRIQDKR
jgi:hypothetical protein